MEQDFEIVKYYAQDVILFIKDFKSTPCGITIIVGLLESHAYF